MRISLVWSDSPEFEGGDDTVPSKAPVYDLVFHPNGTLLCSGYGRFLLVYDAATGQVVGQREAHEGDIYTLTASKDGNYIASGGADKSVCVWNWEPAVKYTYSHSESVQSLSFNPVNASVLASCSAVDFAIWTMPSPQLRKIKVPSKIACSSWTSDGLLLALGMANGTISMRDGTTGQEKLTIKRDAPIWDLTFVPPRIIPAGNAAAAAAAASSGPDTTGNLVVACWDGTLSFYNPQTGEKQGKDRSLYLPQQQQGSSSSASGSAASGMATTGSSVNSAAVMTPALALEHVTSAVLGGGGAGGHSQPQGSGASTKGPLTPAHPTSVRFLPSGEYMVVSGGSDRRATLYTRDGTKLGLICEGKDWIWRAVPKPNKTSSGSSQGASGASGGSSSSSASSNVIAVATNDGTISVHNITFSTVHGLYQDRYAFRDNMLTDVVVQHLVSEQRVRIKCRDYVKKIALYRGRLAVQLPDRIIIYELPPQQQSQEQDQRPQLADEKYTMDGALKELGSVLMASDGSSSSSSSSSYSPSFNMAYRVKDRINAALECNLLVVTSQHVILCQERKLQLYSYKGIKEREWVLDAVIRYIKVVGGPQGKEGLLVGLKNGSVLRIFVDNPFPQPLIKHTSSIRCLDFSMSRRKVAVVDELSVCTVYDVQSKQVLFTENGANSVSWNSEMEDMLCFSGNGTLSIKTGTFPLHTQKLQGFVVGFSGSKVFCLHSISMQTIDIPQSASLHRYIAANDWDMAYRVACLGVTEGDWRSLGLSALSQLVLPVAKAAFSRVGDMRYLELVSHLEREQQVGTAVPPSSIQSRQQQFQAAALRQGALTADSLLAEVLAYRGLYLDAAKLHLRGGTVQKAIEMFSDLRLWNEARNFALDVQRQQQHSATGIGQALFGGRGGTAGASTSTSDVLSSLMLRQAAWCEETGDSRAAATIYSAVGQCSRAVSILGEKGLHSQLADLVRGIITASPAETSAGDGAASATPSPLLGRDVNEALRKAASYFRKAHMLRLAQECYAKLGDTPSLAQLLLDQEKFDEALVLAKSYKEEDEEDEAEEEAPFDSIGTFGGTEGKRGRLPLLSRVHLAYGEWLASRDRLEEAQRHYNAAGRPDLSSRIFAQLALASLREERFADAAAHFFRLSENSSRASISAHLHQQRDALHRAAAEYRLLAQLYRAYAIVNAYTHLPFAPCPPDSIFFAAKFILQASNTGRFVSAPLLTSSGATGAAVGATLALELGVMGPTSATSPSVLPLGIKRSVVVYTLARQAVLLGAYKTCRAAVDISAHLLFPNTAWRDALDLAALKCATRPLADPDRLASTCYRCASISTGLSALSPSPSKPLSGDRCTTCGSDFVRCMLTFDVLPLVEFQPSDASAGEVVRILREGGSAGVAADRHATRSAPVTSLKGQEVLHFDQPPSSGGTGEISALASAGAANRAFDDLLRDQSLQQVTTATSSASASVARGGVLRVPLSVISAIRPSEVFVVRTSPLSNVGFRDGGSAAVAGREAATELRFFKNLIPDIGISHCSVCKSFFNEEEYEVEVLKGGGCCPACKASVKGRRSPVKR